MVIHNTKNSSFMLYLDTDDFEKLHINPESLSAEEAINIFKSYCESCGNYSFTKAYIELFPGNCDLLMFVHTENSDPALFAFDEFESLLSSVQFLPDNSTASLLFFENKYIIAVWPQDSPLSFALSEFGEELFKSPNYYSHILEHGKMLITCDAIGKLKKIFHKQILIS